MYRSYCGYLQKERFLKTGWEHADALDMMAVYSMLPRDDVERYECKHNTDPPPPTLYSLLNIGVP